MGMYALDTAAVATPIGLVTVTADAAVIAAITIGGAMPASEASTPLLHEAVAQLAAYFAGRLRHFDLPLEPPSTPRGDVLRQAMTGIGYGETASYGALAARSGSSARAVGQACARNPLPIVVPCHRVLRAGGALGPYSAGDGPATKRWLLALEGALLL